MNIRVGDGEHIFHLHWKISKVCNKRYYKDSMYIDDVCQWPLRGGIDRQPSSC